jgi:hypothetical protein
MKAYKVEVLVPNFEDMPEDDIVYFIENTGVPQLNGNVHSIKRNWRME